MYREFWQLYVKGYGHVRLALIIGALTIVVSLLEGLNVGLLVPLLETLDPSGQSGSHWVSRAFLRVFDFLGIALRLETILVALASLVLLMAALKYLRMILVAKSRLGFVVWLRSRAMANLLNTDVSYFHQVKLGRLTDTMTTQAEQAGYSVFLVTEVFASLAIIGTYLIAALLISPTLTGAAFGMVVAVTLVMQPIIARAGALGAERVRNNNELQASALESFAGIRVVKAFLLERIRWAHYKGRAQGLADTLYRLERNHSQVLVLQEAVLFALIGAMVLLGVSVLGLEIAAIVTMLFILYRMMPKVSTVNTLRQSLATTMAAVRSVKATMDETGSPSIVTGHRAFTGLAQGIELRGVGFSHQGGGQALEELDLVIPKGRMTAIVGESGSGKSTIVELILRFYDPARGKVLVDGVDLKELDLAAWRNAIGIVSQDIFLFNDTLVNNIALGKPGASGEEVLEAARRAYAHGFIQGLPRGYETLVGDRGMNLSGGERQRIALARAILKKPQILILDEATSALDSESEQLIHDYINQIRGDCTILVVSHRMSTIQGADQIVVLQNGKVLERGDWDSLVAGAGVVASYHRLQSSS